jgi:cobalt/nickel transport system permease protein
MEKVPQWLTEKDEYKTDAYKDAFIDKSILSIFNMITRIRSGTNSRSGLRILNPVLKLIVLFISVLLVALSTELEFVIILDVILMVIISLLKVEDIKHILRTVVMAVGFTTVVLIPSIIMGNVYNSICIILKIAASVSAVNIFALITNWNDITGSLKLFRVPDMFIFVLDTTIKYMVLLGEIALGMLQALKKKSVGSSKRKGTPLSAIMGVMFIKSKEMAEEMQGAMECRGFNGEYKRYVQAKSLGFWDYTMIFSIGIIVLLYFYFGR